MCTPVSSEQAGWWTQTVVQDSSGTRWPCAFTAYMPENFTVCAADMGLLVTSCEGKQRFGSGGECITDPPCRFTRWGRTLPPLTGSLFYKNTDIQMSWGLMWLFTLAGTDACVSLLGTYMDIIRLGLMRVPPSSATDCCYFKCIADALKLLRCTSWVCFTDTVASQEVSTHCPSHRPLIHLQLHFL